MTHCLVTFLGGTVRGQGDRQYQHADYRFDDGHVARATFLGFPLRQWLRADKLVIFGTPNSMWDHLFEGDFDIVGDSEERLAQVAALIDSIAETGASQGQLDALTPQLARALGCEVDLRVIPKAIAPDEQTALLRELAQAGDGADKLSLDITHGFRHLPMLVLTAALYLRALRPELELAGLWYGELGSVNHEGVAQARVQDLSGLLTTVDWLAALQRHEWLGDYEGVAALVESDDAALAEELRVASFLESIHRAQQARTNIRNARKRLESQPLRGSGALFEPVLRERMAWVDEQTLYLRQRRHARDALKRDDYLRAALYGFEAFVTKLTQARVESGKVNDRDARDAAKLHFESEHQPSPRWRAYRLLRDLRNVLAHGNQTHGEALDAIASRARLRQALETCFDELLPD